MPREVARFRPGKALWQHGIGRGRVHPIKETVNRDIQALGNLEKLLRTGTAAPFFEGGNRRLRDMQPPSKLFLGKPRFPAPARDTSPEQ